MASHLHLLYLPTSIRKRIYYAAGLPTRADVSISFEERKERRETGLSDPDLGLFTCLILVCRVMHKEVHPLFYSENRFYIRYHAPTGDVGGGGLAPLRLLSPQALSALSFLTIRLHLSGKRWHSRWELDILKCPESEEEPLSMSSPRGEATLAEWQATVRHISAQLSPGALHLGLVCDVADSEAAHCVTSELDCLPALKQCDIRLSNDKNQSELFEIAKQAATQVLRDKADRLFAPPQPPPFRFMDLPQEIRLCILGYTDLVSPLSMIFWKDGRMCDFSSSGYITGSCENDWEYMGGQSHTECEPPYDGCHPRDHEGCDPHTCLREPSCPHQCVKCWRCSHYGCQFKKCWKRSVGSCFCRRLHTAYSKLCRCWRRPTPLFLVSRAFCEDSRAVFWSQNHFKIDTNYWDPRSPRPPRHAASIFLRDVVPTSSLRHLRSLDISRLWLDRYPFGEDAADRDWLRTIEHLKDKVNPRFLKMEAHTAFPIGDENWPDMRLYRALEADGDIYLLRTLIAAFWPLEDLGSNSLEQLYVTVGLSQDNFQGQVGYYFRNRKQAPLATARTDGDFNHERNFRHPRADKRAQRRMWRDDWVEGIWGYVHEL